MTKKKKLIITLAIISVMVFVLIECWKYYYNYEKKVFLDVLITVSIDDSQEENMDVYACRHFGSVDKEITNIDINNDPVALSSYQRNTIRSCISTKSVQPYNKLWYRYDAIIMYGNDLKYMIDMKNGIIFAVGEKVLESADGTMKPRYCIRLSEIELDSLKKALKDTGINNTD